MLNKNPNNYFGLFCCGMQLFIIYLDISIRSFAVESHSSHCGFHLAFSRAFGSCLSVDALTHPDNLFIRRNRVDGMQCTFELHGRFFIIRKRRIQKNLRLPRALHKNHRQTCTDRHRIYSHRRVCCRDRMKCPHRFHQECRVALHTIRIQCRQAF